MSSAAPAASWPEQRFTALEPTGLSLERRRRALQEFVRLGFPNVHQEEWKYTNLAALSGTSHTIADASAVAAASLMDLHACYVPVFETPRYVFVNGHYAAALSTQASADGLSIEPLAPYLSGEKHHPALGSLGEVREGESGLCALNSAFAADGAAVVIAPNVQIADPVHLVFIASAEVERLAAFPRVVILAGRHSRAAIVQSYVAVGEAGYFTNAVVDLALEEGAQLELTKFQCESRTATHVSLTRVQLSKAARFASNVFQFGGALVREEIHPVLDGEGSECILNGLSAINGSQHVDNVTVLDHAQPNCFSRQEYKGIYGDTSSGVFSGTIVVRPGAQKTNAVQSNQSILLSPTATIDTRPQLKIWADDVKCTHGATVGQLDDDALFYIRTRGIGLETARQMLIHAFASDVVQHVASRTVRDYLERLLMNKLEGSIS